MSETSSNPSNGNSSHFDASREHVRAAATDMRDAATEAAREIRDRANAFAGEWKGRLSDLQKETEEYVRANPTKSVLAAVGAGFVIGLLCRK